ncbi:MAG: hypothetical protein FJ128_13530, partial [Deltaproteobacteria bacterium]|nr:hypothetical protein [Deltaproteobacteria bacterium]
MQVIHRLTIVVVLALVTWLPACVPLPPPGVGTVPGVQDHAYTLFQEAEDHYRRHAYRQAYQRYAAYLQRYPQGQDAVRARLREAECLGLLGDWEGSLRRYQSLSERRLEPETAQQARYGVGRAAFKLGRHQYAVQVLESLTAGSLSPQMRFSTNALLTEIALKEGKVAPAFARLRLAGFDLAAGDQEWFDDLKSRLVQQATSQELEQLADLYRDTPLSAALLARLVRLAQEQGRTQDARQWLNALKERFPDSPELQNLTRPVGRRAVVCLLPLSGDFAEAGRKVKQGMELAAQAGGVELQFQDCPADPEAAAKLVRELAQTPHYLAIIGPLTSGNAQAAAKAAQEGGIPLLCLAQRSGVTAAGHLVFQIALTPRAQVRELVRFAMTSRGAKRFAVFAPESPYGRALTQAFKEEVEAQGGVLAARETYAPGTQDFTLDLGSLLTAYKPGTEGQPTFDALFIPDDAPTVAAIVEEMADSPLSKILILGTNLAHPGGAQKKEVKHLEGVVFTDVFFKGDTLPATQKFVTAFEQRHSA